MRRKEVFDVLVEWKRKIREIGGGGNEGGKMRGGVERRRRCGVDS